jgi:hypothetical protein
MKKQGTTGPGVAALLALIGLAPLHAATLNVPSAVYPTIQAGVDAALPGDTVLVADGTYTGPGNTGMQINKDITVKSVHGAAHTIIDCQGTSVSGITMYEATIDGFTIKNGYDGDFAGGVSMYGGTLAHCVITGCSGDAGGGVFAYGPDRIVITGCTVSGNTGVHGGGIFVDPDPDVSDVTIDSCTVSGNFSRSLGGGITMGLGRVTDVRPGRILNSVVTGNVVNSYYTAQGGGIYANGATLIANCTVADNLVTVDPSQDPGGASGGGIYAQGGYNASGYSTIINSIITHNTAGYDAGIHDDEATAFTHLAVSYCFVQDGQFGNEDRDPYFVNESAGDFHLKADSPAINVGTIVGALPTDIEGNPRPSRPGIGAYEYTPQPHPWSAISTSAGADGFTRVLWDNRDGTASVWKLDASGNLVTQQQYGPYPGWIARDLATGPDGISHLLWTNASGLTTFWRLDDNNVYLSQQQYGPYDGWNVIGLTVAPDDTVRALWDYADGSATVWTLDGTDNLTSQTQLSPDTIPFDGPYDVSYWTARSLTAAPDGTLRLLWDNAQGRASVWRLTAQGQYTDQREYGAYPGWTARSIAAAPDGTSRFAWTAEDGTLALWTLDPTDLYTGQTQFGPYDGWSYQGVTVGSDGNARVLWDNVTGQSALWSLTPGGGFASNYQYGPY